MCCVLFYFQVANTLVLDLVNFKIVHKNLSNEPLKIFQLSEIFFPPITYEVLSLRHWVYYLNLGHYHPLSTWPLIFRFKLFTFSFKNVEQLLVCNSMYLSQNLFIFCIYFFKSSLKIALLKVRDVEKKNWWNWISWYRKSRFLILRVLELNKVKNS